MKTRILLSYHYHRTLELERLVNEAYDGDAPDIFIDSGAFSAMTQGAKVDVKDYAAWVKANLPFITTYANLDVIMDGAATLKNQRLLEDECGLAPLPVFHVNEDFSYLDLYSEEYDYIALGVAGMQTRKQELFRWLAACFRMAGDRAVFHGFGLTAWDIIYSFPWYSVDSASWGSGFLYGRVPLFDKDTGAFVNVAQSNRAEWHKARHTVSKLGYTIPELENGAYGTIAGVSALSYALAEEWVRGYRGNVPLQGKEDGLKIYLALTVWANKEVTNAVREAKEKYCIQNRG